MSIYKAKVESSFAIISNKTLRDDSLSYEATGLLAMMLSLPDDWEIHKSWLQKQKVKCGRDKLTGMMNELISAGYVVKKVKQQDGGRLNGVDWLVYGEPQDVSHRTTEKPSDGKPTTTKKDLYKEKILEPKHPTFVGRVFQDQLEKECYPNSITAMKIFKSWKKAGASNLYDGSLKVEQWEECEQKLNQLCDSQNDVAELLADVYKRYNCKGKESVSLPYLLFAGIDSDELEKIIN